MYHGVAKKNCIPGYLWNENGFGKGGSFSWWFWEVGGVLGICSFECFFDRISGEFWCNRLSSCIWKWKRWDRNSAHLLHMEPFNVLRIFGRSWIDEEFCFVVSIDHLIIKSTYNFRFQHLSKISIHPSIKYHQTLFSSVNNSPNIHNSNQHSSTFDWKLLWKLHVIRIYLDSRRNFDADSVSMCNLQFCVNLTHHARSIIVPKKFPLFQA